MDEHWQESSDENDVYECAQCGFTCTVDEFICVVDAAYKSAAIAEKEWED